MNSVVVMGVAGCGKSSVAQKIAQALGLALIEGDEFHSEHNQEKMRQGLPLTDADRADWLTNLGLALAQHQGGAVLTCSALKRAYRDYLRSLVPDLRFVFLEIDPVTARRRVTARAGEHLFPPSLVQSQFATLESPVGESGVLRLDATLPLTAISESAVHWLRAEREQKTV